MRLLQRAEEVCAGALLVAVMGLTLFTVVNRYVFRQSAVWAPELTGFLFTWVVFLGISAAANRSMHVSVGVIVDRLPQGARRWVLRFGELILIAFFAYAGWLALHITVTSYTRVSPAMRIPFSFVYASVAISFALMFGRSLAAMLQSFRRETTR